MRANELLHNGTHPAHGVDSLLYLSSVEERGINGIKGLGEAGSAVP